MAEGIFYELALPDDPCLDRFSSGYKRTDDYFRSREWFKADKGRSAPPTYVFRVARGGPVVGYCAFDFGKQPFPVNASETKARYLVIYMIGVDQSFQRIPNPQTPGQTYATSIMAVPPSARKDDASPFRSISTRGLDGAIRCVVTARRSKLMSEGG